MDPLQRRIRIYYVLLAGCLATLAAGLAWLAQVTP